MEKRFPYFFHGAFAPSFIWSRRRWFFIITLELFDYRMTEFGLIKQVHGEKQISSVSHPRPHPKGEEGVPSSLQFWDPIHMPKWSDLLSDEIWYGNCGEWIISRASAMPFQRSRNIFGTFCTREHTMRNIDQILNGDQTRCEEHFCAFDSECRRSTCLRQQTDRIISDRIGITCSLCELADTP